MNNMEAEDFKGFMEAYYNESKISNVEFAQNLLRKFKIYQNFKNPISS